MMTGFRSCVNYLIHLMRIFFGKNIIHYNWKNVLLGIVVAVSAIIVIIAVATNTRSGCSVVVFGHMYLDDTYMREALVAEGIKRPYIGMADIVVPNDQNIPPQEYGIRLFGVRTVREAVETLG